MADNELALLGGGINASTVSEALTQELEDTLLGAVDAKEAAREVAKSPALLAEARDRLSIVSRLAGPVGPDALYTCLQPLFILYGPPDFGQDEEAQALGAAWFDIYAKALAHHPREAIEIAVSEAIRTNKYGFPKPAVLDDLARSTTEELQLIAFRLRKAVERAAEHKPAPKRTPEDTMAVRRMMDQLKGPDGRVHLSVGKTIESVTPPSDRRATAEALRKLADYQ